VTGKGLRLWLIVESSVDVRLVDGLAEAFDVTVVARIVKGGVEVSRPPSAVVRVVRSGPSHAWFAWRVLIALLTARRRIDLVVVQNYGLAALAANLAGRLVRVPTVMYVCSPLEEYYLCRRADSSAAKPFRPWELMILRSVARANAFVGQAYLVLSEHLASTVRRHGSCIPIEVCPVYGVDTVTFAPTRTPKVELRRTLGLPEHGSMIFFSSRIAPEKDVDTLLSAVRLLVERGRDVILLNASGGHLEIADRARLHGVGDRLIARPAVDPRSELARYYQASDVCVQASRAEGLGFSPLEALSCGIPVVAAHVGGLRETIIEGSTGWTYQPGDSSALARALAAALDDSAEADARAERGRRLVADRFARQKVFAQAKESLRRLAAGEPMRLSEFAAEQAAEPALTPRARPRVALVVHAIAEYGGMDRALSELIRRGGDRFDFVVLSTTLAPRLRPLVEWRSIRVPRRPAPLKFALFFLVAGARLARERFDLVCTVGAVVPNHADVAFVHYCHAGFVQATGGLAPDDAPALRRVNTSIGRFLSFAAERWCYRVGRVRCLAAVSRGLERELVRNFPRVPVVVVPNGVDSNHFGPPGQSRTRLRSEHGVASDDVAALFVGGDWGRKGLAIAIEGLARARAAGADLGLWVVGKGDEARFAELARSRGVGDSVMFFGPRADTEHFYRAADLFVLPTQYEAFSLAMLEALAAGIPVVTTRVNGVDELFDATCPGIIVQRTPDSVGAALLRLARSSKLREEMGRAGVALAHEYTWERSVEGLLDIYRDLLQRRPAPVHATSGRAS
jgi:glycosyltransferase involved in cell wall biosynthesis